MNNPIVTTTGYGYIAFFLVLGLVFIIATLAASWAVRRRGRLATQDIRLTTYECGEVPVGDAQNQFHVGYYIFALIFVVFDIETVFLAPWALALINLDPALRMFAFLEMVVFLAILVVGLVYAWKKGVLQWT